MPAEAFERNLLQCPPARKQPKSNESTTDASNDREFSLENPAEVDTTPDAIPFDPKQTLSEKINRADAVHRELAETAQHLKGVRSDPQLRIALLRRMRELLDEAERISGGDG